MRLCDHCGGCHRLMEICPEAPGLGDLLRGWIEGDRSLMSYVAVVGTSVLFTLWVVGLMATFAHA